MIIAPESIWALLIGINDYGPQSNLPKLNGCINDLHAIRAMLQGFGVSSQRIRILASDDLKKSGFQYASYAGIIDNLEQLMKQATEGGCLFLYYSGHGVRLPSVLESRKGAMATDEALVPADISSNGGHYFRDIELYYYLRKAISKGLKPILILDSCHSGGADRMGAAVSKSGCPSGTISFEPKADPQEIFNCWSTQTVTQAAGLRVSPWAATDEYLLMAASAPHEPAFEYRDPSGRPFGVFTHFLTQTWSKVEHFDLGSMFERVKDLVRTHASLQMPQMKGRVWWRLGCKVDGIVLNGGIRVLEETALGPVLNSGGAQGLVVGSCIGIMGETEDYRLARVTKDGGIVAQAEWLTDARNPEQRPLVSLDLPPDQRLPVCILSYLRETRFGQELFEQLEQHSFIRLVGLAEAHFRLACLYGRLLLLDHNGNDVHCQGPKPRFDASDAMQWILDRLIHLARYAYYAKIQNTAPSALAHLVQCQLYLLRKGASNATPLKDLHSWLPQESKTVVPNGSVLCLRINNPSRRDLRVSVLCFQPDFGISQLLPSPDSHDEAVVFAQNHTKLYFGVDLPGEMRTGTEQLRVFLTQGSCDYGPLQMSALNQPMGKRMTRSSTKKTETREIHIFGSPADIWWVERLEINLVRK